VKSTNHEALHCAVFSHCAFRKAKSGNPLDCPGHTQQITDGKHHSSIEKPDVQPHSPVDLWPPYGMIEPVCPHVSSPKLLNGFRLNLVFEDSSTCFGCISCWSIIISITPTSRKSRDSSVGIALGYGLDDRGSWVRFPAGAGNFSLHHRIQNGSGAHPASYTMGTRGSFPGGKAAGERSWPLTSI
jgi:hypothetical protein